MTISFTAAPIRDTVAGSEATRTGGSGGCTPPGFDAVFVDLDNTLVKGSALFHVGRGLAAAGVIRPGQIGRLAVAHALYRLLGERPAAIDTARRRGLSAVNGLSAARLYDALDGAYDTSIAPRLWDGTVQLIRAHRDAGTPVWLATAAPIAVAELVARRLGLSGALGTRVEEVDGAFTGHLAGPMLHGPAKAAAVTRLAAERGWDLADCAALSDSAADLPLLQAVGHPTVVNPEHTLARIATSRGWQAYDFRARAATHPRRGRIIAASEPAGGAATARTRVVPDRTAPGDAAPDRIAQAHVARTPAARVTPRAELELCGVR